MLPDLRTAGSIRDISEMIARFLSGTLFGIVDRRLFGVVTVVSGALVGHVRAN